MKFFPHSPHSVAFQTPSWLLGRILKSIDPRVRLASFTFLAPLFALHYETSTIYLNLGCAPVFSFVGCVLNHPCGKEAKTR